MPEENPGTARQALGLSLRPRIGSDAFGRSFVGALESAALAREEWRTARRGRIRTAYSSQGVRETFVLVARVLAPGTAIGARPDGLRHRVTGAMGWLDGRDGAR